MVLGNFQWDFAFYSQKQGNLQMQQQQTAKQLFLIAIKIKYTQLLVTT